ncbi:hypothetical protein SISNIDRAFT_455705 [Sistotremastrum niveocremeum HHB9708]|uniref:Folate-sensitive fragile site protein Fra10Ac1 n=2 Tax=Sistotremastraceae TaxID=3402574 RepID=A0A164TMH7_9AGAM|nr:hypothetical protein SISNIDRAFT_455705 [Sistotremastrum niveocremeum HHB9708]KZT42159.1 hypothetical protein SISSUDRAFT_1041776 [Sistotremastrum suecicum HHB10207 ss-3]
MSLYPPRKHVPEFRRTELDVLKSSLKFLRDDDEKELDWDDAIAKKYYSSLFREFAVCDLKHYKSGNIALRWRTEDEVLSGAGESTCGNTRCEHHAPPTQSQPTSYRRWDDDTEPSTSTHKKTKPPKLITLELPFAYEEQGQMLSALVKVVVCSRCRKKIDWKRQHDKQMLATEAPTAGTSPPQDLLETHTPPEATVTENLDDLPKRSTQRSNHRRHEERTKRPNHSRSRSPRARRRRSRSPLYGRAHDIREAWMPS